MRTIKQRKIQKNNRHTRQRRKKQIKGGDEAILIVRKSNIDDELLYNFIIQHSGFSSIVDYINSQTNLVDEGLSSIQRSKTPNNIIYEDTLEYGKGIKETNKPKLESKTQPETESEIKPQLTNKPKPETEPEIKPQLTSKSEPETKSQESQSNADIPTQLKPTRRIKEKKNESKKRKITE